MKKISFLLFFLFLVFQVPAQQIPRSEYPRPQFERTDWINLNGSWTYCFDFGNSGKNRGLEKSNGFDQKIIVPFCPESSLSGVEHKDFINYMWYQKKVMVPTTWTGKKVLLHFGAVYYEAEIFINGKFAGRHYGGTSPFELDITNLTTPGKNANLVVHVSDNLRSNMQGGGKQCSNFYSGGCSYTRTTGIWQTVWMEAISPFGLKQIHMIPDIDQKQLVIMPVFFGEDIDNQLKITLKEEGKTVSEKTVKASNSAVCILPLKKLRTWSPEDPFLYDIQLTVTNSKKQVIDKVKSYIGMRKISIKGNRIFLNNVPYYQRLVLAQGYYPDGIWTAPSDKALKKDIELMMQAGFNGARLHQKVFEERFHYWADKLGFLTWAESSSWGLDVNSNEAARNFISEWRENVVRERNHPSIVTWTPFNETWHPSENEYPRFVKDIYNLTKSLDPTRPVNDASGDTHVLTDIWTVHNYAQDPEKLSQILSPDSDGKVFTNYSKNPFTKYSGQPYLIDEFGGIKWSLENKKDKGWGYGNSPKTMNEFYTRLDGLVDAILSRNNVWGYCYTQFTDVEQERNGIFYYNRNSKFDIKKIHAIFSKKPENK